MDPLTVSDVRTWREEAVRTLTQLRRLREDELPKALQPVFEVLRGMGACAGTLHRSLLVAARETKDVRGWPQSDGEEIEALLARVAVRMRQAYAAGYRAARDGEA